MIPQGELAQYVSTAVSTVVTDLHEISTKEVLESPRGNLSSQNEGAHSPTGSHLTCVCDKR